jgi:hypothetical protein
MRFIKFFGILLVALTCGVSYGQSQPENSYSAQSAFVESVHIFPNPAIEYVHIKIEQVPASQVTLAVHNILGNEMDIETEVVDEHELRIKVKELASGYYLLAVRDKESKNKGTFKFLKR